MKTVKNSFTKALSITLASVLMLATTFISNPFVIQAEPLDSPDIQIQDFENGLDSEANASDKVRIYSKTEGAENVHGGDNALYIPYSGAEKSYTVSDFTVEAGEYYMLSFWVRFTDSINSGYIQYEVGGLGGTNSRVYFVNVRAESTDTSTVYKNIRVAFSSATTSTAKLVFKGANSNIFVDDVVLSKKVNVSVDSKDNGNAVIDNNVTTAFYGDEVTFTATPNSEYAFKAWVDQDGNEVSKSNPYVHTVTGATTLTATFEERDYSYQYQDFEGGYPYTLANGGDNATVKNYVENDLNIGDSKYLVIETSNNDTVNGKNDGVVISGFKFERGAKYQVTFKYKRNTTKNANLGGWSYIFNYSNHSFTATDTEWKLYNKTITIDDNIKDVELNRFRIRTNSCNKLYIDDIAIKKINPYHQVMDFESEIFTSISNPQGVGSGNSERYIATDNDQNVYGGNASLKIEHNSGDGNLVTRLGDISLTVGKTYNVTFKYKASKADTWFYVHNHTVGAYTRNTPAEKVGEWQEYNQDILATSAIMDIGTTTADTTIFIDDVLVREKSVTSITTNKEAARVDWNNGRDINNLYVGEEISFKILKANDADEVKVTVNGQVLTADQNGDYIFKVEENNTIALECSGEYADSLPNAGATKEGVKLDQFDHKAYIKDVWKNDIVYHEPILFYDDLGGEREAKTSATMLYPVDSVISLRSYDLKEYYVLGVDYNIVDGKIVLTENTGIPKYDKPFTALRAEADTETDDTVASDGKSYADSYPIDDEYGLRLITNDKEHYDSTVVVTYIPESDSEWDGALPIAEGNELTNFYSKLRNGEDIDVLVYGDSVATGASSSGRGLNYYYFDKDGNATKGLGTEPNIPPYFELAINELAYEYGAKGKDTAVNYYNIALGGRTSGWGFSQLDKRVDQLNTHYQTLNEDPSWKVDPDVIVLTFFGNDLSGAYKIENPTACDTTEYKGNMSNLVAALKAKFPTADIILTSGKISNHAFGGYSIEKTLKFEKALIEIAAENQNVVCAPVTTIFQSIVEDKDGNPRKDVTDYLSNNINHANDYGAQIMAQCITGVADLPLGDVNLDGELDICDLVKYDEHNNDEAAINVTNRVKGTTPEKIIKKLLGLIT